MSHHLLALRLASAARDCAPALARAGGGVKNSALSALADLLRRKAAPVLRANAADVREARRAGLDAAMIDRLRLDRERIAHMADGVLEVAALPDPVGVTVEGRVRADGLRLSRVRAPLGVVLLIYESRPNVTVDAAALCLKSGNAALLRGGRESLRTNLALGELLGAALGAARLPADAARVVPTADRELVPELLRLSDHIDLVVPRGGKSLIQAVAENSRIPVLKHLDGVCHVFVDLSADPVMAEAIAWNAKLQRPGTCNAMETLLVHRGIAARFLPAFLRRLAAAGVRLVGDAETRRLGRGVKIAPAGEEAWRTEYLGLGLNVAVVKDLEAAIGHINTYGSKHTDAIVTRCLESARRFQQEVDSGSVMVNASTRLADGFEYGLGAEIGISTDKLHARGPVGLEGLTTTKWLVEGDGHLRS